MIIKFVVYGIGSITEIYANDSGKFKSEAEFADVVRAALSEFKTHCIVERKASTYNVPHFVNWVNKNKSWNVSTYSSTSVYRLDL